MEPLLRSPTPWSLFIEVAEWPEICTSEGVLETNLMTSETIHEFELQGCHFYIVWKPGLALLRVIESYGTPDQCHYTAADLFADLYDGSPEYELTREEAIYSAPLIAETLLIRNRIQEAPYMEKLYNSLEVQAQYPVYQCRELVSDGENHPFVWGSHN